VRGTTPSDLGRDARYFPAVSRAVLGLSLLACACGSDPARKTPGEPDGMPATPSNSLAFDVTATSTTYVNLGTPGVVEVTDPSASTDWDLAFNGYDVRTNGGRSGPGNGSAFGPLPSSFFAFPDEPIEVPFLIQDDAGGVFLRWYAYDGTSHTIYSRYHVYGIDTGDRRYKLQILGYYGEVEGAPVSALYQLRYAEVTADGSGDIIEVADVNGTLDGATPGPDVPSACLTLATGETSMLSPNEAEQATTWDVCFRREAISVNGEIGGPGNVTGVDLESAETDLELLSDVKKKTADSELSLFDSIDDAALTSPDLEYRGDYVTSAFTGKWVELTLDPPAPKPGIAFLVVGANGTSRYLIAFDSFDGADAEAPGTVHLGIMPVVAQ